MTSSTLREFDADAAPAAAPFADSTELMGDVAALRDQLQRDGYLFLRQVLSATSIKTARADAADALQRLAWVGPDLELGTESHYPSDATYWAGVAALLSLPSMHALRNEPVLRAVLTDLFGCDFGPHARSVPRIAFPTGDKGGHEAPAHQDYIYGQGGLDTLTVWMPLVPCTPDQGALEVLAGSHRDGLRPIYGGSFYRCSSVQVDHHSPRWHGGALDPGDIVLFTSLTVHRARSNRTDRLRMSMDSRFQSLDSPWCASALEPAFFPRVPHWSQLLPAADAAAMIALPPKVRLIAPVPPEQASLPNECEPFPWLIPSGDCDA
jgi:hypothetical protein